jgi:hypothetical protein
MKILYVFAQPNARTVLLQASTRWGSVPTPFSVLKILDIFLHTRKQTNKKLSVRKESATNRKQFCSHSSELNEYTNTYSTGVDIFPRMKKFFEYIHNIMSL